MGMATPVCSAWQDRTGADRCTLWAPGEMVVAGVPAQGGRGQPLVRIVVMPEFVLFD